MKNWGLLSSLELSNFWKLILVLSGVFLVQGFGLAQDGAIDVGAMGAELGTAFQSYIKLIIQVLSVVVFLIVGYGVISKFMSAVNDRAAWAEVAAPILFGAVVLVATAYFFNQATTLADSIQFA